jgi:nitrate reductase gamma subunit
MDRFNEMINSALAAFNRCRLSGTDLGSFPARIVSRAGNLLVTGGLVAAVVFVFSAAPTVCNAKTSKAGSWFVDMVKYHISAHGQTSCQDCHPDVAKQPVHPNPADVTRSPKDFFNPETCFNCHDGESIKANLAKGLHGGKPIEKAESYSNCISCHDPHYQPRLNKKGASELGTISQGGDQCSACHEKKQALPKPADDDVKCVECHKSVDLRDPERGQKISRFCLGCHGNSAAPAGASVAVPLINTTKHLSDGHNRLDCMTCHPKADRFVHNRQTPADCRQCHTPHPEAIIHDAHAMVTCQACHLTEAAPSLDAKTGKVTWVKPEKTTPTTLLNIRRPADGTSSCRRCHHAGNKVGAAAMILPAKSIICMPCHAATFSAGDTISVLALLGFALGMCVVASVWLSGTARPPAGLATTRKRESKATFSFPVAAVLKALFLDGLLQRRLYIRSRSRWFIHSLIFWPFLFRFSWGLVALVGSLAWPSQDWVWKMLDKNYPLTAFFFDLTGLMVIAGVILAILRKRIAVGEAVIDGLPERDWLAVGLLGAIVIVGFILEGARIALTGVTDGAHFAFLGWAISFLWRGTVGLNEIYGYIWYTHALLTGAFLVYLPFSGMFHLIMAPIVMMLNAAGPSHSDQNHLQHSKRGLPVNS